MTAKKLRTRGCKLQVSSRAAPLPAEPAPEPYKLTERDRACVAAAAAHEQASAVPPKIELTRQEGHTAHIALVPMVGPHEQDQNASKVAFARLSEAFGNAPAPAVYHLLANLINGTNAKDGADERAANEALALTSGIAPKDTVEAMLSVQMINTHRLIAEFHRRMMNTVETIPQQDSNGSLLVKLLRTFTAQIETLKRYRSGGEQRVSVTHQHVTVNADRAAVAVNPPGGPGAMIKTEEQPHAPTSEQLAYAPGDPLPGSFKENGEAVSGSSR